MSNPSMSAPAASTTMSRQLGLWDARTELAWRVRASTRARRLSARVFRDGSVEIVVPQGTRAATVSGFVARYRRWIERHQRRASPPVIESFPPAGIALSAIGEHWHCRVEPGSGRVCLQVRPGTQGGELVLSGNAANLDAQRLALRRWLTVHAHQALLPRLVATAADMELKFSRLQIRRQRTRWGSCSARGTISLNCCLLFQRPEVARYLLVHELAHLRHMNHGIRFKALVARHEPDWRTLDRELLQGWRRVPQWVLARSEC